MSFVGPRHALFTQYDLIVLMTRRGVDALVTVRKLDYGRIIELLGVMGFVAFHGLGPFIWPRLTPQAAQIFGVRSVSSNRNYFP